MTDNFSELLYKKLNNAFHPTHLDIINESQMHAGHREAGESINSHFKVVIASTALANMTKIKQHRAIYAVCDEWMHNNPIHALAIEIQS